MENIKNHNSKLNGKHHIHTQIFSTINKIYSLWHWDTFEKFYKCINIFLRMMLLKIVRSTKSKRKTNNFVLKLKPTTGLKIRKICLRFVENCQETGCMIFLCKQAINRSAPVDEWGLACTPGLDEGGIPQKVAGAANKLIQSPWAEYGHDIKLSVGTPREWRFSSSMGYVWN